MGTIFPMLTLLFQFLPSFVLSNAIILFPTIPSFTTNTKKKIKKHKLMCSKNRENQKLSEESVIAHQEGKEFISVHTLGENIIMLIPIFKDFSKDCVDFFELVRNITDD